MGCGSNTVKNGVCIRCGYKPKIDRKFYSKKEWAEMIEKGMLPKRRAE